ncbi:MAG: magnesium transporter, partial [Bacilli bacterium]
MDNLEDKITSEQLIDLVNNKKYQEIRDLFVKYPEIDIAEICNEIDDVTIIITIFRVVKSEFTAELFHNLDQDHQEALIKAMTDKDINTLIGASANDDIVDFLEDMPANLVKRVLQQTTKDDRVVINKLLNYKENTAGSIMTTEYIELLDTTLIQDAISLIRQNGKDAETIYTIFCKDIKRNFLGTVDLDDLIFAQPTQTLNEIMNKDFVTVDVNTDQEEVAQIVKRYDLNAIAVLNDDHKLSGIITIDDVVDIIDKEATEDIAYQAGVSPLQEKYLETPVFKMAFKCIPWLMLLLVLGVFSSMVLSSFQSALALVPILSAFIPAVMDAGGNAGSQTSSVIVRSLALNEFKPKDFFKVLWKEVRIAIITACILAIFA